MKGWMYLLECSDGSYYTGSTKNLELRLQQHQNGEGANHTKKHLPVKLVYFEEFQRIDHAFYREKQVQGWSRKKKEALINGEYEKLPELSKNYTQASTASTTSTGSAARNNEVPSASIGSAAGNNDVPSASIGSAAGNNEVPSTSTASTGSTAEVVPEAIENRSSDTL